MCMDGIDACFAGLPLFGELPSGWRRLELDYEMEASPRNLMLVPPICTATVYYSGRAVVPVEYLKKRVREIVRANPWLGGRLRKGFGRPFLAIPKSPMEDHFVECKDALSINPGMCFRDLVGHVQMSSATLKCGLACLNRNEQLFRVAVLPAQPDHFLLVVSLNHTIGDGFTFYKLCGMLDSAASVVGMNPCRQVGFAKLAAQHVGPEHFNWLTSCPTVLGSLRSFCLWHPPAPQARLVDRKKILELRPESSVDVSTNDILTSHLLLKSRFGYGYMSINLRNRGLGPSDSNAGNYIHRVHLAPPDFSHPAGIRKSIAGSVFCGQNKPPGVCESICLRHGLVSNWSKFFQEVSLPDCSHVSHMPILPHPLPGFGLILIFKPNRDQLAVYYTMRHKEAFQDVSASPVLGPIFSPFQR
ncbi:unnamed protein product [Durusdinium trenchii]|uniref:Uncharacterized protein n=1 Tax=Durusdinium trenchii TaxID=1381693 RepID=A0ABP0MQ76_9DINO